MKKAIIILLVIVLVLGVAAVFPIPHGSCDDGSTREFICLSGAYKLIKWNKLLAIEETSDAEIYSHRSIFWYPDSDKSIDELWKLERESKYYKKTVGDAEYGEEQFIK